jgi:hypothetical protein
MEVADLEGVALGALRVGGEELAEMRIPELLAVLGERVPFGPLVETDPALVKRVGFGHQSTFSLSSAAGSTLVDAERAWAQPPFAREICGNVHREVISCG